LLFRYTFRGLGDLGGTRGHVATECTLPSVKTWRGLGGIWGPERGLGKVGLIMRTHAAIQWTLYTHATLTSAKIQPGILTGISCIAEHPNIYKTQV